MKTMGKITQENWSALGQEHYMAGHHKIPRIWIIAADRSRVRIFRKPDGHLEQIGEAYPDYKSTHVSSHALGRIVSTAGTFVRHRLQRHKNPSEGMNTEFVKELVQWLDRAVHEDAFDRLILAASPRMLGDLRRNLSAGVQARVVAEVNKDLTKMNERELWAELKEIIWF